ncbi:MAG: HesB/IscA family protein [Janthinobacterium lividum]
MMATVRPPLLTLTSAAVERLKILFSGRGRPSLGIRIGIRSRGCNGLSYTLEFTDEQSALDDLIEKDGVKILIDPKAALFLLGTEMDFVEEKIKSGFTFRNPNEKGRCGCDESFHV